VHTKPWAQSESVEHVDAQDVPSLEHTRLLGHVAELEPHVPAPSHAPEVSVLLEQVEPQDVPAVG
jgi:hypothetical protein